MKMFETLKRFKAMKRGNCKECGKYRKINKQKLCFWCWDKQNP